MKEVINKEVMRFLDSGIIYPIYDSKWVRASPTEVAKFGPYLYVDTSGHVRE